MKETNENYILVADSEMLAIDLLRKHISFLSKNNLKSSFQRGQVTKSGKVLKANDVIYPGENINLSKSKKVNFNVRHNFELNVLYEDSHLVAVEKPEKLLTVATNKERYKTLYHIVTDYVKQKHVNNRVFIVHRLDQETSGVVVFAKSEKVKEILQRKWEHTKRTYIAIVEGKVYPKTGEINTYLHEDKTLRVYSSLNKNNGKEAITKYKVVKQNKNYTMLEIDLITGRKNQIRVHMLELNTSVIGDKKYGSTINPLKRMGLHATKLEFKHPVTNKNIVIESKLPDNFLKLF